MARAARFVTFILVAGIPACTGDAGRMILGPTAVPQTDVSVATSSIQPLQAEAPGCHTPQFHVVLVPSGTLMLHGVLTGDLEGTVDLQFDATSITFAGVTVKNAGTARWNISGGIIPDLGTFETVFENMNLRTDRPGSPATRFENKGKHRAVAGLSKANLTYKGTFDSVPSPRAEHDYQGVICK